ncbi:MAG: amino acid racemase [Beijerinckiaceae bacterium]|jgi:aspartate racemase|nr:amino acid racemase [Beijerinckiaceae bacterium]
MTVRRMIGVLGGMGPLATVDFMHKIIQLTPADRDQDHIPMVVVSVPQIPDRATAVLTGTDEPFPGILSGLRMLERAGAALIVIPCNTAHVWFDRLAASTDVELIHMADAVRRRMGPIEGRIALLATEGTVRAGFYQRYLYGENRAVFAPPKGIQGLINRAIAAVKAADLGLARTMMEDAATALLAEGATHLLLACTELPIAAAGMPFEARCLDATRALAEHCIAWSTGAPPHAPATPDKEDGSWISDGSRIF